MVVGPNLGGNVEPAPSIAKWQTIKQHWHMHSTMTKTGGRERERERERDGETDAVETPRANAWTAMTHDEIVKTGSSKITKAIVQLLAHKASQHRRSCWLLVSL